MPFSSLINEANHSCHRSERDETGYTTTVITVTIIQAGECMEITPSALQIPGGCSKGTYERGKGNDAIQSSNAPVVFPRDTRASAPLLWVGIPQGSPPDFSFFECPSIQETTIGNSVAFMSAGDPETAFATSRRTAG